MSSSFLEATLIIKKVSYSEIDGKLKEGGVLISK